MSELSEAESARDEALSRFETAKRMWAFRGEGRILGFWWDEYQRAADEYAAAARRVLHQQTIAGE